MIRTLLEIRKGQKENNRTAIEKQKGVQINEQEINRKLEGTKGRNGD